MGYDWTGAAEAPAQAEIMPEGYHKGKVTKVIMAKGDGTPLTSTKGDPQILCVLANAVEQEATITFTLNEKAGGILASFLKHAGADLERMTREGLELSAFEDEAFAKKQLEGRECWILVEHRKGKNDRTFANAKSVDKDDVPPHELQRAKSEYQTDGAPMEADDIPF